ncbi:MAG: 30S ribosomal protein S6 [Alphaproteobacteria bacterium MarineAlpha4_Bin2]|nr:MAG: 30S ribosomal protein S6 [Alphaproteobacteria bacterium MarineAlpha4_Bin2]
MPLYESVLVARQDISAGQVDTLADDMEKIITDAGGSVARREYWGLRSLAYRMKKNRKGHYVMFNLDAPSKAIQEMERNLRLHEDVLRYMTIRIEELRVEPSPMAHGKGDRDRAERRGRDSDAGESSEGDDDSAQAGDTGTSDTPAEESVVPEVEVEEGKE